MGSGWGTSLGCRHACGARSAPADMPIVRPDLPPPSFVRVRGIFLSRSSGALQRAIARMVQIALGRLTKREPVARECSWGNRHNSLSVAILACGSSLNPIMKLPVAFSKLLDDLVNIRRHVTVRLTPLNLILRQAGRPIGHRAIERPIADEAVGERRVGPAA
jgi:hypothetical protein